MKKLSALLLIFVLLFEGSILNAQKREFRASWTASVSNLDWPSARNLTVAQQKNELVSILDQLQSLNINAVFLQIRPECDALYSSSIEPWSYWLNGTQGTAPSPLYDPLEYAIDEAHQRGIELHAWLNPYRAEADIGRYALAANHVINLHPDWILTFGAIDLKLLDPGKSAVRTFLVSIITDIVSRYDIDGIVLDDYFYPYPNSGAGFSGISTEDAATFAGEPRGFTNLGDWRRDNVNLLIQSINSAIKGLKPYVKFGISPFGIWKNGVPSGIIGLDAYSTIYCDATAWLTAQSLDYISPQLYWPHGGSQDYAALMPWWASQTNDRHLYVSHALSRSASWPSDELTDQIELNRLTSNCYGSVFFRTGYFDSNPHNIVNSLQTNYYQYSALTPDMDWLGGSMPNAPSNLEVTSVYNGNMLGWNNSTDPLRKFNIIYRDDSTPVDISDQTKILDVISSAQTYFHDQSAVSNTTYYYCATSLNKYDIESVSSGDAVSNTSSNFSLLDNFESSVGHFDKPPTYSGSTAGIDAASSASRTISESFNSSAAALQVVLKDDPVSSNDWFTRLLSGTGVVGNNVPIDNDYSVGYWMKTSSAPSSAQISLLIRDEGALEKGLMIDIINDGNWHLYKWDLNDNSQWTAFTGNGQIDGLQVTLDAIVFTAPNASPDWTIFVDDVHAEEFVPLPVELVSFEAFAANSKVELRWQTATELNNYGFVVRRSEDGNIWKEISFVEGYGNSSSPKYYSFEDNNLLAGTYDYQLQQIDNDGGFEFSNIITATILSPLNYVLYQNYPNPFNPSTKIKFTVPGDVNGRDVSVRLIVYDILGNEISVLVNELKSPGSYEVEFNKYNSLIGQETASGVYFYTLAVNTQHGDNVFIKSKKMMLLK